MFDTKFNSIKHTHDVTDKLFIHTHITCQLLEGLNMLILTVFMLAIGEFFKLVCH